MNFEDMPERATDPLPEPLLRRIETAVLADLRPVRPVGSVLRISAGLLSLSALVAAIAIARLGWAGWSSFTWLQAATISGILLLSLPLLAHSLSKQMTPGSKYLFSPVWLLALPLSALAAAFAMLFFTESSSQFLSAGFRCWRTGIACAAVTAAMIWLVLRRGFPLAAIPYGMTAGLLAGLTGVAVLTIECNLLDGLHLIVWHLGAAIAAMVAGACIGYLASARLTR